MPSNPIQYLENSFLAPLLQMAGVTDISYNGSAVYYVSNADGRQKSDIAVTPSDVADFLRQIANLTERQFSVMRPILDVSFGRYRLNAVNSSLCRVQNAKTFTFSLRIESGECAIRDDDHEFLPDEARMILTRLLEEGESIVIGGLTSTGKTELQKWLLLHMKTNSRVIVIDNVEEIDMVVNERIDLSTWLINEESETAGFAGLIRNALRNNPDYIVVAEARGAEMLDALTSAMSGHPIITTIHAKEIRALPSRIARLAMLGNERLYREELLDDIGNHIRYYVYVRKRSDENGRICRYVSEIGELDPKSMQMNLLYERKEESE